ncbi:MAG: acyl-CoA thioesterase [Planctomycetota bacterium]
MTEPAAEPQKSDLKRATGPRAEGQRRLALRVVAMPRDTNPYGTIFGGVILSYIDQAGFVEAMAHSQCLWVTASVERVDFAAPVHLGDIVSLWTSVGRFGTRSITIEVDVVVERRGSHEAVPVTKATLTMVSVDADGHPIPFRDAPPACIPGETPHTEPAADPPQPTREPPR